MYVYICVCMYMYNICIIYVNVYVCMYIIYVCMYVYVCIYICTKWRIYIVDSRAVIVWTNEQKKQEKPICHGP